MEQDTQFLHEQLDSGMHVIGQPMEGVESAAVGILIGTGARDEDAGAYGISHFTEQMLFRGSQHHDARSLSNQLDGLGVSYDTSAGLEMSVMSALLLGDNLAQALDLLIDVLRFPAFAEDEITNVRTLLLQELYQRDDQPAQKVMDVLRQNFFAGSPLSHDVLGSEKTISAIERQALEEYWRRRYTANNISISISGKFDWSTVLAQLQRLTDGWHQGTGRMETQAPETHRSFTVLPKESTQENLGFAFPAVSVGDPQYYSAAILSQALGGSSNSRLFQEVRDKRGLAYSVHSRADGYERTGLMRIYVGTSAERAHESVSVVIDELHKLEQGGITEAELDVSKTRLKSQLIMRGESTSARMMTNLRNWWYEGRLRTPEETRDEIQAITIADVNNMVERLGITKNLAAVALGPRAENELFADILAPR